MAKTILQVLKEITGNTTARTIAEIIPELLNGSHYGSSVSVPKGTVAVVADLPSTGNEIGDLYHVEEDQSEYMWLPTSQYPNGHWENIGSIASSGNGFPEVTVDDVTRGMFVNSEGEWELSDVPSGFTVCTWTKTVENGHETWTCDRNYTHMVMNKERGRLVIFKYGDQLSIANWHHASGESDHFVAYFTVKEDGVSYQLGIYCISGLGNVATKTKLVDFEKLVVEISESGGVYTANKTYSQISDAISAGRVVECAVNAEDVLHLYYRDGVTIAFCGVVDNGEFLQRIDVAIESDNSISKYVNEIQKKESVVTDVSSASITISSVAKNTIYEYGTLSSLTVTAIPASGDFIIRFTSGSTATTTSFPASMKFPEAFAAEVNTRYEINVSNGYALAVGWPTT